MQRFEQLEFDNIYASLPPVFFSRQQPEALQNQFLIHFNNVVSEMLGIDPGEAIRPDLSRLVTMTSPLHGFDPIAMCYSGHQFGQYVPRLGDGRAILLGQLVTESGERWDLQLKGAGQTLYSRQGDGKAVLRSTIREYLCSAAMHGLGIPTTHSLAMFGSDEEVYREQIETGAMLIRVAPSHIRFGSFEYFFYTHRYEDLKILADFTINNYFSQLKEQQNKYLALLKEVIASTASLIAHWQSMGFCHGVMNSDNMSIHGITIDYGPFGFLDGYDAGYICNHSDHSGRYAYDQQPRIALFNLSCLAQAMLPLFHDTPEIAAELATDALQRYDSLFDQAWIGRKRKKLGFQSVQEQDGDLYDALMAQMQYSKTDFTRFFRHLSEFGIEGSRDYFLDPERFDLWAGQYCSRLEAEKLPFTARQVLMKQVNPKYILRNYLAENAIKQARDEQDYGEIDTLMRLLARPFDDQSERENYAVLPPDWASSLAVSCSS